MTRLLPMFFAFMLQIVCLAQTEWTALDHLNRDPFTPEKPIRGVCFISLAEGFDYYTTPIIVAQNDSQVVKIEFVDTLGMVTSYKGRRYVEGDTTNPFNPWLWVDSEDYFQLAFECTDTTEDYYEILVSESEFVLLSKRNNIFKKESIEEFVGGWTAALGLDFDRETNPLKTLPFEDSETILHPSQNKYKIWEAASLEINGDWLRVITVEKEIGWIKWRNGSTVLIRMYFAC